MFGTHDIAEIFSQLLTNNGTLNTPGLVFASLGAGDLVQEVGVAKKLRELGLEDFVIEYALS